MKCLVTAGPTCEPLDAVRCLTNASTGRLGSELAAFLVARGHEVTLLLSAHAVYRPGPLARHQASFSTTADLQTQLMRLASSECEAVFHVAAVSDFAFGGLWERTDAGLRPWPTKPGKIPTSAAHLLLELRPTPKLLDHLPAWFPRARIVGWKLEVDGDQVAALAKASEQIQRCGTHACVANGPAYGPGFGLVTAPGHCRHCPDPATLYQALAELIRQQERSVGG